MSCAQLAKALVATVALLAWGCRSEPEDLTCYDDGDEVMPDEEIRGIRMGDLLEPYFGDYQGTLSWATGGDTAFTLSVPYEAGTPYRLSNVWQCDVRNVYYWSDSQVTTDDGAFDNEVSMSVGANLSDTGEGAVPDTVASFSALSDFQWQPGLPDKLGVALERYKSSYVLFELDWPPGAPGPSSGILRWRGTLLLDGKTSDTVQVGTLSF